MIGHYVAMQLQTEGAQIAALTFKPSTDHFTRTQREVKYELIRSHDEITNDPVQAVRGVQYSLSDVCDGLNVPSLWPFAQALRNHVRTYSESYYYSYRQNVADEGISDYFKAVYHLCTSLLDEFQPDIVIAPNFVALPHIFMKLLTAKRGVPMFGVTDTKIRGVQTFTHSYLDETGPLIERIDELEAGSESPNEQKAREYIKTNREALMRTAQMEAHVPSKGLYRELRSVAGRIKRGRSGKDYMPAFGQTIDSPGAILAIRDFIRHRQYTREARNRDYVDINTLGSFAFFPLQVQPEESIDVIAPLFNNQLETARQVAMSLPGDLTLAVKDHPAMEGLRKPDYLEKLARTPNVKLLDYRIPTDTLLRSANLIVAPTGTVFAEAAILGVPGVQLGQLGTIKRLPNVVHHSDISTLTDAVKKALDIDVTSRAYTDSLQRYVMAAYDAGFELDYFGLWERGNENVRAEVVQCFVDETERSLAKRW